MFKPTASLENWRGAKSPERITIAGTWVTLEPLDAALHTAPIWAAVSGHDAIWDYLSDVPYTTEEALGTALAVKAADPATLFFAIRPAYESRQPGPAAGYASLMRIDAPNGVIEVGNILFSPRLQRTRAATEAMYLMARFVFEDLGYRRYEWKCNALNLPSRRAALRLGFSFEGVFRQHMVIKGQNRDTAWYAMLDSEWPERKLAFESWLRPENFDSEGRQFEPLATTPK